MAKKKTGLFIAVGATAMLLAGCGGAVSEDNDYLGEIHFWSGFGGAISENLEKLIDQYNKRPDTDYKVNYFSDGTGYSNLLKKIQLSIGTAKYPNIAVGYPDHMAAYITTNILQSLDKFYKDDEDFKIADFVPDYLKENQELEKDLEGNQLTWGLPFNKSTEVMVVNETFLALLRKDDSTIKIPTTWAEVATEGKKIRDVMVNYYGKADVAVPGTDKKLDFSVINSGNFVPFSWDSTENMFITIVRQWGGEYTKSESFKSGTYAFDSDETRAALAYFKQLNTDRIVGVPATYNESLYVSGPFKSLKTLFTISSSAGIDNNIPSGKGFDISVHEIPYNDAPGMKKYVISQGTNILMFKVKRGQEAKQQEAWKFMKYLTTEVNDVFAMENAYYPVTYSMLNSEKYTQFINATGSDVTATQKALIESAAVNNDIYLGEGSDWVKFVDPGFAGSSNIRSAVGNIVPNTFSSDYTIEQAIKLATSELALYAPGK